MRPKNRKALNLFVRIQHPVIRHLTLLVLLCNTYSITFYCALSSREAFLFIFVFKFFKNGKSSFIFIAPPTDKSAKENAAEITPTVSIRKKPLKTFESKPFKKQAKADAGIT